MTTFDFITERLPFDPIPQRTKAEILEQNLADLVASAPQWTQRESDPLHFMLDVAAAYQALVSSEANDGVLGTYLSTAKGQQVDRIGDIFGLKRRDNESDDPFKVRIVSTPYAQAAVGSLVSIRANAFLASDEVRDIQAVVEANLSLTIHLISNTGAAATLGVPSAGLIATVQAYLTNDRRQHITDRFTVAAATIADGALTASVTYDSRVNSLATITAQTEASIEAWANTVFQVGRTAYRSSLIDALVTDGVITADVTRFNLEAVNSSIASIDPADGTAIRFLDTNRTITYSDAAP